MLFSSFKTFSCVFFDKKLCVGTQNRFLTSINVKLSANVFVNNIFAFFPHSYKHKD